MSVESSISQLCLADLGLNVRVRMWMVLRTIGPMERLHPGFAYFPLKSRQGFGERSPQILLPNVSTRTSNLIPHCNYLSLTEEQESSWTQPKIPNWMKAVTEKKKKKDYRYSILVVGLKLKDFPGKGEIKCSIPPNELLVQSCTLLGLIQILLNNHKFLKCETSAQNVSFLSQNNFCILSRSHKNTSFGEGNRKEIRKSLRGQ